MQRTARGASLPSAPLTPKSVIRTTRKGALKIWPRRVAVASAVVLAALEVVDAFRIDRPVFALALAILFALGAILVGRGDRWAALLIGLPALIDLLGVITFYGPPEGTAEIINFVLFGVFSALALVGSVWVLVRPAEQRRRADV